MIHRERRMQRPVSQDIKISKLTIFSILLPKSISITPKDISYVPTKNTPGGLCPLDPGGMEALWKLCVMMASSVWLIKEGYSAITRSCSCAPRIMPATCGNLSSDKSCEIFSSKILILFIAFSLYFSLLPYCSINLKQLRIIIIIKR